jgi:hypothetical protein
LGQSVQGVNVRSVMGAEAPHKSVPSNWMMLGAIMPLT